MKPAAQCCLMGYPIETTKQSQAVGAIKKFNFGLKMSPAVVLFRS